jgi:hypothetical protein
VPRHSGRPLYFFKKNSLPRVPYAHVLGEAPFVFSFQIIFPECHCPGTRGSPLLFFLFSFALRCDKQSIYLYKLQIDFNISQTTFIMANDTSESTHPKVFINDKRHIQKCDQISLESNITNHTSKSTNYSKFTSAIHKNESAGGSRQLGGLGCPNVRSR